jgi:outer membrane protein assembly factor BamB
MKKRFLVIGVFFLLIVSTLGPLSFGYRLSEKNSILENYNSYNDEEVFGYSPIINYKDNSFESEKTNIVNEPFDPLNGPPMDSAWPMYCHDTRHTGRSLYSTTENPYEEKWRFYSAGGSIDETPVIDSNGIIYFCGAYEHLDRYLFAIYPDGTEKWRFKTDGLIFGSSPAIDEDGTIYVGSWDTKLYAINPNGTLKWESPGTGGSIACSPAIGEDGTIYIGNYGSKIVAINPNGTIKWFYNTDDDITSDPAIADDGTIYIGSLDSYLYALYPNGTLRWRFKTGDRIYGSPSIADDGTVYIGSSWDSYLYAIYPNNGTLKWKYGGAGTPNNPSIGSDGTVYAGYLYDLIALYPNGNLKWDFYVGNNRYIGKSAPAISADGTIYFGIDYVNDDGGEIIAVNPNGTERWRKKIANWWVDSSPSIAEDGTVYIGSTYDVSRGYIHAFGNIESNSPPNTPGISGPTNVNVGEKNWYIFTAIDPDNNPIQLFVDWGDGTSGWIGEYASGEPMWVEHAWNNEGTYTIKAKVKDVLGEESDFGYLEVKVIVPPVYKKVLIFGIITNLTIEDTIMFEAVHIKVVRFLPFSISLFKSGEKFTLTNNYRGFIGNRLIFSLCTMIT